MLKDHFDLNSLEQIMLMEDSILDNIRNVDMGKECIVFVIEMCTLGHGKMTSLMDKEYMKISMEINIKASSSMAVNQAEGLTFTKVVQNTMGNGRKIKRMDLVSFITQMDKDMKEIGSTGRNREKEHTIIVLGINILDSGPKIRN